MKVPRVLLVPPISPSPHNEYKSENTYDVLGILAALPPISLGYENKDTYEGVGVLEAPPISLRICRVVYRDVMSPS